MLINRKSGYFMGFGAVLVVVGAVLLIFWPPIFTVQLRKMMILTNESSSFNIWRKTPIPMYLEVHFFNITNVDDILARKEGIKLQVKEIGPYVFRELHIKTNLTWNTNSTVTFYNQRWWHFVPERSVGPLSDEITSINPVIATITYAMRHRSALLRVSVDAFLHIYHKNMFLKANISSWMFDGIEDPLLKVAERIPHLPIKIEYDRFAWFYGRNGSIEHDGVFNMNTGATEFSELGNVETWHYSNRTKYRGECGAVKGSTGELWRSEYEQPAVNLFTSDLCTYLTLSKDGDVTVQGIDGVQYVANETTFDNGHKYPHMACYCDEPVSSKDCLPSGALNISQCTFGAPAFVSLPHFLNADQYYPSKIDGLNATKDMNFRLTLEMFTGMPLTVEAQLQMNLLIRYVTGLSINNVLPDGDTLVPMFWFRQKMEATSKYADIAKFALRVRYWVPYALYAFTVLGFGLLVSGIVILIRRLLNTDDDMIIPILSEEEPTTSAES